MNELEQVTAICRRLGAVPPQDVRMAAAMLKRAEQLAISRSTTKATVLQELLTLVYQANQAIDMRDSAQIKGSEGIVERKKNSEAPENH